MRTYITTIGLPGVILLGLAGCAGARHALLDKNEARPAIPESVVDSLPGDLLTDTAEAPARNSRYLMRREVAQGTSRKRADQSTLTSRIKKRSEPKASHIAEAIQQTAHEPQHLRPPSESLNATLTIEGRTYRVQLIEEGSQANTRLQTAKSAGVKLARNDESDLPPIPDEEFIVDSTNSENFASRPAIEPLQLNLPTALSMVGGQHPAVGFAQWRVQEAYAVLDRSKVLWLPSIQPGFSFHKHDGNYQASNADIVDVHRNSFQYGLGAGATGAGTTPRPGIVAQFHLADAIFQPEIDEKTAWARSHAANGVVNEQLRNVAIAYLDLLDAEQDLRIIEETRERTAALAKLTSDFAATGQGLQADADRLQTELTLVDNRLASAHERIEVASARLSQTLSIDAGRQIVPLDPTVVPVELVSPDLDKTSLIRTGLENRPELMEAQALVAAACEQHKRQKYSPFVPSVLLGFSNGGFGGGQGNSLNDVEGRYDFDALLTWEIRNLGFGEEANRRETAARVQQAGFEKVRLLDQVAREISEAHSQTVHRAKRIEITKNSIESAENTYNRNLGRIRDAQGLPIEVLQSIRALEDARRAYLKSIIEYNQSQFRLQWALGWPVAVSETDVTQP